LYFDTQVCRILLFIFVLIIYIFHWNFLITSRIFCLKNSLRSLSYNESLSSKICWHLYHDFNCFWFYSSAWTWRLSSQWTFSCSQTWKTRLHLFHRSDPFLLQISTMVKQVCLVSLNHSSFKIMNLHDSSSVQIRVF
jgi:hypothetical protein